MTEKKIDFYQLGNKLWNIANIFRDDTLKTTEYLEEFSYFLFLKLFDDQEIKREKLAKLDGKEYVPYLPEELRFYNWATKIINNEIDITQAVSTVKEVFQKLATIKDHDGKDLWLFRKLFQNHIWRIKYGPTIRELLKQLIDLKLEENFDVMGRAYEFVVQKLGEQKQYGQYFTPRHIIHFMVELADPEIGEAIYDPAAGTGGFILRAFEVVKEKIDKQTQVSSNVLKEPTASYGNISLDKAEKLHNDLKERHLYGVEKAPDVYKLAMMNMILHNDGKSNLKEADSLDNRAQQEYKERFNVVLSNPPYGPLTQSRTATFTYHVKRFEALFIQHIMNALKFSEHNKKPNRAVVIILDKILFDSTRAFKGIRQKLLREYNLKGVFSMPAGIFQPYSGVKTTVLYFERPIKEEWKKIKENNDYTTKQVLFFDVKTDGFTLSTQRRPINGAFQGENPNIYEPPCGDLPKAVEVFKEWLKALDNGTIEEFKEKYVDNEQVWIASIEEIKEKDFNLNPGLYRKVERGKVKWDLVSLFDVADIITESVKPFDGERFYLTTGNLNEDVIEKLELVTYKDRPSRANLEVRVDDVIFAKMKDTKKFLLIDDKTKDLIVSTGFAVLRPHKSKVLPKYLYYIIRDDFFQKQKDSYTTGATQKAIGTKSISKIFIPLPPLEIQQKIVERLDKQQAIIEKAKEMEKVILGAGIDDAIFEGDWEWVELGDNSIFDLKNGGTPPKNQEKFYRGNIPWVTVKDINNIYIYDASEHISNDALQYSVLVPQNSILIVTRVGLGKVALNKVDIAINQDITVVFIKEKEKILPEFLLFFLLTQSKTIERNGRGTTVKGIPIVFIKSIKIPLPPLEKQQEIVEFLDVQFEALEKIRKMRENAEKMIKIILEKEVFGDE